MALFVEIAQVLIALGLSSVTAFWLGPMVYLVVALCVFAATWLLMLDAAIREPRVRREALLEEDRSFTELVLIALTMAGTAIVFSVIWPALPPILVWSAWRRRQLGDVEDVVSRD